MNLSDLLELEPRLHYLEKEVESLVEGWGDNPRWCANAIWYGYGNWDRAIKRHVMDLVGWERKHFQLIDIDSDWTPGLTVKSGADIFDLPDWPIAGGDPAELHTPEAYSIVYDHLFKMLPDCAHSDPECGTFNNITDNLVV